MPLDQDIIVFFISMTISVESLCGFKGANPQRVSTEITIEIKQLYSGRIALNPFIASNHRYMVYPLRDDFPIENVLLFV